MESTEAAKERPRRERYLEGELRRGEGGGRE